MDYKKQIKSVVDNKDKQQTYKKQMGKYKRAINGEFYFEAMLIVYATLEDRLRSFLYYLAVIRAKESRNLDCKKTKAFIRELVYNFNADKKEKCKSIDKLRINLADISEKIDIIKCILTWVDTVESNSVTDEYQRILKFECESLDIGGILETFEQIDEWRKYRNEIIHGLMNKNIEALDENLAQRVQEGMEYVKFIASEVRKLKNKNKIRKLLELKKF